MQQARDTPKLIPAMAGMVASGLFEIVLASRILGGQALAGGMPRWPYVSNRGYRAFSRALLERLRRSWEPTVLRFEERA